MRTGRWILSIAVVVGAAGAAGAADDVPLGELRSRDQSAKPKIHFFSPSSKASSEEEQATLKPAAGTAPQRYTRTKNEASARPMAAGRPAAARPGLKPVVKNYYQELFEEADREAAKRSALAGTPSAEMPSESSTADRYRELIQAGHNEFAPEQEMVDNPFEPHAPAASKAAKRAGNSNVINAEYRKDETAKSPTIQQVKESVSAKLPPALPKTKPAKPAASPVAVATESESEMPRPESGASSTQTPAVSVKWVAKGDVNVGQECKCDLVVQNTSKVAAKDVVVEAHFPRSVRLVNANPYPTDSRDHLEWKFELLAPGESKTIEINMIPTKKGELATSANVRFTGTSAALFQVEEPQLKLALKGPQEVMVGDPASQLVTVSNPGTGVAHDVVVEALVPNGLEHSGGKRLTMGIGSLSPGESRSVRLALAAVSGGEQILLVEAKTASANLVQSAEARINVMAPSLDVKVTGPSLRYLDRNAKYTINVTNSSTVATNNVRVLQQIPAGFEFVRASRGGKFEAQGKSLTWFVGRLESGQAAQLEVELAAKELGQYVQQVRVIADNGVEATASAETRVEGTASIVMEVVDLDDPVEVASETAYEIRLKNEGSKAAANVSLSCELPAGVELINCKGPSDYVTESGMLIFKSLPQIPPKQTVTYRVHVRGTEAGNLRFRARLTSDSIQKPLIVEEVTQFYAD